METTTNSVESLIRTYISSRYFMQLATARDGQPWCCTVHFYADGLNLYWISATDRRHSLEIAENARTSAAIVIETDKPVGVQVEGDAEIVTDKVEAERVLPAYAKHHNRPTQSFDDLMASSNRLYRLTPRLFVLFDVQNSTGNPRHEWRPE